MPQIRRRRAFLAQSQSDAFAITCPLGEREVPGYGRGERRAHEPCGVLREVVREELVKSTGMDAVPD